MSWREKIARSLLRETSAAPYAYILLLFLMLAALAVWKRWQIAEDREYRQKFSETIQFERERIQLRLAALNENMRALAALHAARPADAEALRALMQGLRLADRYPGLEGAAAGGFVGREIALTFAEPADFRPQSITPERRADLERALLTAERSGAPAFVSDGGESELARAHFELALPAGPRRFIIVRMDFQAVMRSAFGDRVQVVAAESPGAYTEIVTLEIGGLKRNIFFRVPEAPPTSEIRASWVFLGASLIVALCLFLALRALLVSRVRAQRLAEEMTVQYRDSERRSEAASQAKTEFLARMSHEIRTPLNAVLGAAELLRASELGADQRELVDVLDSAGKNLLQLINDVLDLSRIESGRLQIESIEFDPRQECREVLQVIQVIVERKGLTLSCEIDPALPARLIGDPNRIRQSLWNLCGNAVKFTERGGIQVAVRMRPTDEPGRVLIEYSVEDSGVGIPPDRIDSIFEDFTQVDSSVARKFGGTGLGLAITRKLVHLMGGEIHAESEPGRGSRFTFTVNVHVVGGAAVSTTQTRTAATDAAEKKDGAVMRILLVEDTEVNRTLLGRFLRKPEYSVEEATNGVEAVAKYRENSYDVILMDIEMPEMDGLEATRQIRQIEETEKRPRTPVIALTAHALDDYMQRGIAAGCDRYLTKPIRMDVLYTALREIRGG
jgi:hypothetical protein